jgi:hypothetical protein
LGLRLGLGFETGLLAGRAPAHAQSAVKGGRGSLRGASARARLHTRTPACRPPAPRRAPSPRPGAPSPPRPAAARRAWPSMGTGEGMRRLMRCGSRLRPALLAAGSTYRMRAFGEKEMGGVRRRGLKGGG